MIVMETQDLKLAPEFSVSQWFNSDEDISLAKLKGKNVIIYAFQLLCPACVSHSIPQAKKLEQVLDEDTVLLGLHTVFEHHDAMGPEVLQSFLYENKVRFPVGVDAYEANSLTPKTMTSYQMRGTPSMIIINKEGQVIRHFFGVVDDLELGLLLGKLK